MLAWVKQECLPLRKRDCLSGSYQPPPPPPPPPPPEKPPEEPPPEKPEDELEGGAGMVEAMMTAAKSNPGLRHGFTKQLIPDSIAMPEDIANAVAWLASDEASLITGAAIPVDVGVTSG